jgi:hypothetical protein
MSSPGSTGYHLELESVDDERQVVCTGSLPRSVEVRQAVTEAYDQYRDVREGENASHYPALARVDPDLFGIAVVSTAGELHAVGAADTPFAIMSIAKPFVLALVDEMQARGITTPLRFSAALADGEQLWAVRWASDDKPPSLYLKPQPGGWAIASEPLGDDAEAWQPLAKGEVVHVHDGRIERRLLCGS